MNPESVPPPAEPALEAIDRSIHDLVMRRAAEIARTDRGALSQVSPAQQTLALRALLARHSGQLRPGALARLWRELVSGTLGSIQPAGISVYGGDDPVSYWDIARCHFGASAMLALAKSPLHVLQAVDEGRAGLGVLPDPAFEEEGPSWWGHLLSGLEDPPRIVARLPVVLDPALPGAATPAYVIGRLPLEATGEDTSLLIVATEGHVSRARLLEALTRAEVPARIIAIDRQTSWGGQFNLIAVDGFVSGDDRRLGAIEDQFKAAIRRVQVIGAYANPIRCGDSE